MTTYSLVLASKSPRRRDVLARLSIYPAIEPADIDETPHAAELAPDYVERLAREKAAVSARPQKVVLAADTAVIRDGKILGQPESASHAEAILLTLEGRSHDVLTGVAVSVTDANGVTVVESAIERSTVAIRSLSNARRRWYANSGEPDDKAGAYGIQGAAALFADSVTGSVTNVIGLPLPLVDDLFTRHGLDLLSFQTPIIPGRHS